MWGVGIGGSYIWPSGGKNIQYSIYRVLFLWNTLGKSENKCWAWNRCQNPPLHGTCGRRGWWHCADCAQVCPPRGKPCPGHGPLIVIVEHLPILEREHKRSNRAIHLSQILHSIAIYKFREKRTSWLFFLLLFWHTFSRSISIKKKIHKPCFHMWTNIPD